MAFRYSTLGPLMAAIVFLLGCGGSPSSNQAAVTPAVMNFGNVPLGSSSVVNGALVAGNSAITVSTVDQSGEGYTLSGITFPLTLSPYQKATFSVMFTPEASGASAGTLAFVTSSSTPLTASLTGASGGQPGSGHSVQLNWRSVESGIIGYNVYRSQQSGGPFTKLTDIPQPYTTYADYSVQSGQTYYYVATSINTQSQESGFSNQTIASVP